MTDGIPDPETRFVPDPDNPGWRLWQAPGAERFADIFTPLRVRIEEDGRKARCRIDPRAQFANSRSDLHGGFLAGMVDHVLFIGPLALGYRSVPAVTLDMAIQFLDRGSLDTPLDAVVEVLRETGRMIFVRGVMEQEERAVLAFSGTLRRIRASA